jgi:ATP-dependent exoDNAse (exonuclease V) alpha subunit
LPGNTPDGYIISDNTQPLQAQSINERKLAQINDRDTVLTANKEGDFRSIHILPDYELVLKEGAQVCSLKMISPVEKLFYNGKIGVVEKIDGDRIHVKCAENEDSIIVEQTEWQNCKFSINEQTEEIQEEVVGTFTQYPLKLAWAITIHKSQGLTFEKAIIDANAAFAHGQVSGAKRCNTLVRVNLF